MRRSLLALVLCVWAVLQLVLDDLRDAAKQHGLTFGPDPSTHNHCTLGGMLGNNSGGVHSIMAGLTIDNVESLNVLTYDGLRLTVGATPDAELEQIIAEAGRRVEGADDEALASSRRVDLHSLPGPPLGDGGAPGGGPSAG